MDTPKLLRILYQVLIVIGICGIIYLLYYFIFPALLEILAFIIPILMPFILGALIAALMEPFVSYLDRKFNINRGLAAFLTLSAILAAVTALVAVGISRLTVEMAHLSKVLPAYIKEITQFFRNIVASAREVYETINVSPEIIESIFGGLSGMVGELPDLTSRATEWLVNAAAFLPMFFLVLIIALIAAYFMSRDKEIIKTLGARFLPTFVYETAQAVSEDIGKAIFGYIRAQIILVSITTIQSIIGLYLIGINYAIIMGLILGIVDFIPYFGPGAIFIPWIIYEFAAENFRLAIMLSILYIVIIVVRQVLEPKIVAENIGLHPLATLMAMFVGFKIFGVIGVVIGPLLLVVAKAVFRGNIFSRWM